MKISERIKEQLKIANMCGYTVEYSDEAKHIGEVNTILNAEQHSQMSEIDFHEHFTSTAKWFQWYFRYLENLKKIDICTYIGDAVTKKKIRNVVSFGCGPGCIEQTLFLMMPDLRIVATDYDKYIMDSVERIKINNTELGGYIQFQSFDFYTDDVEEFIRNKDAEMVVMIGAGCGMDHDTYLDFLKSIGKTQVKTIITFEAAVLSDLKYFSQQLKVMIRTLICIAGMRNFYDLPAVHAYRRSRGQLESLFRGSGWDFRRIIGEKAYEYAYILEK